MRRLLILLALVALPLGLAPVVPAQPEPPRLEGEWAVLEHSDFNTEVGDLIIMRPDAIELTNLTNGAGYDIEGQLSPDGTAIAFTSVDDGFSTVWLMDVDGENRRQLSGGYGITPTWTPDGLSVVYAGSNDIRIVQRNGDDDRPLGQAGGFPVRNPSVSPDGTAIVFDASLDESRELFTMPITGGEATQITTEGGFEPEWSPVENRILFTSFRGDFGDNILATNPDGTEQEVLVPSDDHDFNGTWSPDGSKVMYESVQAGTVAIVVYDRVDATYVEALSTPIDGRTYRRPSWTGVSLDRVSVPPPTTTSTSEAPETTTTTVAGTTTTVADGDVESPESTTDWVVIGLAGSILVLAAFAAGAVVGSRWGREQAPPPPPPE